MRICDTAGQLGSERWSSCISQMVAKFISLVNMGNASTVLEDYCED